MDNRNAKKGKSIKSLFTNFKGKEPTTSDDQSNVQPQPQPQRIEIDLDSLERDPFKRISICEHPVNQRDEIRRAYIKMGAFQPILDEYKPIFYENQNRRFQRSWFHKFSWLEYSPTNHAAYCFPCFLFDQLNNSRCAFTHGGFSSWKKVNNGKNCSFLRHVGDVDSQHKKAVIFMNSLKDVSHHIDKAINREKPEKIKKNRLRVMTTVKSIQYLTLQACALRGHDESESSKNRGNFIELIKLLGEVNVEINDVVLEKAPLNAKYTSPTIQKEILSIFGSRVRSKIREEIGDSKFCILVDEAKDISNREQMAIVLRFVDVGGVLKERFLDIVHVKDTTAVTLKKEICLVLSRHNLQICNMRGQGYDGASNMGGVWNRLQALFLRDCPYAYHVHFFAHRLQLALVAAGGRVGSVYCFFSSLNKIVNIVGASPKRHTDLQSVQAIEIAEKIATGDRETGRGANQIGSLHRPGETRWSSHFNSTCSLIDMYGAVITVLDHMIDEGSSYDRTGEAYGCRMIMKSFDFVFILHLMNKILGLSDMLCQSLQQKSLDILNAMDLVSSTKGLLRLLRDDGFDCLLSHVKSVCREHHIVIPNMGDCYEMGTGRSCQQVDTITFDHHYRFDVFNEAIDTQLNAISDRFKDETVELLRLSAALDPKDNFRLFNEDHIYLLADKFYPGDFTDQEMIHLRLQLQHYRMDIPSQVSFRNLSTISQLSQKLAETNKAQTYNLITRLIHLVLTLHVTTATTERAFSAMKHVKSVLRNKMEGDYLSDSMVVYIERELFEGLDPDSIIDEFYRIKKRKAQLM